MDWRAGRIPSYPLHFEPIPLDKPTVRPNLAAPDHGQIAEHRRLVTRAELIAKHLEVCGTGDIRQHVQIGSLRHQVFDDARPPGSTTRVPVDEPEFTDGVGRCTIRMVLDQRHHSKRWQRESNGEQRRQFPTAECRHDGNRNKNDAQDGRRDIKTKPG